MRHPGRGRADALRPLGIVHRRRKRDRHHLIFGGLLGLRAAHLALQHLADAFALAAQDRLILGTGRQGKGRRQPEKYRLRRHCIALTCRLLPPAPCRAYSCSTVAVSGSAIGVSGGSSPSATITCVTRRRKPGVASASTAIRVRASSAAARSPVSSASSANCSSARRRTTPPSDTIPSSRVRRSSTLNPDPGSVTALSVAI